MGLDRIRREQAEEIRRQVTEIALQTGAIYKNDQGELCPNDDEVANGATYGAVTNALKAGTIKGDRKDVMDTVKSVLELPD